MAKDFVFRIKPGDPLPPIAPSGYRFMLDESDGSMKLLASDGTIVNPKLYGLFSPTISDLQTGDFIYSNDGVGFQNTPFTSVITGNYGYQEYTYVEQTEFKETDIFSLSGKTLPLIKRIEEGFYVDVDKIICEINVKTPYVVSGVPVDLGLEFSGQAAGALGNIDISFLTATESSFVVLHANKTGAGGVLPTVLPDPSLDSALEFGLSAPATIDSGQGAVLITVFYKIRQFGAQYVL